MLILYGCVERLCSYCTVVRLQCAWPRREVNVAKSSLCILAAPYRIVRRCLVIHVFPELARALIALRRRPDYHDPPEVLSEVLV